MGKGFGTGPVLSVASTLALAAQEQRRKEVKEGKAKEKGKAHVPDDGVAWEQLGVGGVILQSPMISVNKAIEDQYASRLSFVLYFFGFFSSICIVCYFAFIAQWSHF
jgi:hypothetical protein